MQSAHDPVGAASARLLAIGVPRPERLFALRVLGLLLDHADVEGIVRVHPATLAAEFALDRSQVDVAYLRLRAAGVLLPSTSGWRIDEYDGYRSGGVNAGDALAMIADLLETSSTPAAANAVGQRTPIMALVAVALMLLVAVASQPRRDPEIALRVADATGAEEAEAEADVDDRGDVKERRDPQPVIRVDRRSSIDAIAPLAPPAPLPPAPPMTAAGPATSADAAAAAVEAAAPPPCPAGEPAVVVAAVKARLIPSGGLTMSAGAPVDRKASWRVSIDGTASNEAERAMVLEAFDVVITTGEGEQVVHGLAEPVVLPPGGARPWQVVASTPLTSPPPDADDVAVVVRSWRWTGGCSAA